MFIASTAFNQFYLPSHICSAVSLCSYKARKLQLMSDKYDSFAYSRGKRKENICLEKG